MRQRSRPLRAGHRAAGRARRRPPRRRDRPARSRDRRHGLARRTAGRRRAMHRRGRIVDGRVNGPSGASRSPAAAGRPAGGQHRDAGTPRQQRGDVRRGLEDLLDVVEEQQVCAVPNAPASASRARRHGQAEADSGRDRREHSQGSSTLSRGTKATAPGSLVGPVLGDRERHPGLADATWSDDRDQPGAGARRAASSSISASRPSRLLTGCGSESAAADGWPPRRPYPHRRGGSARRAGPPGRRAATRPARQRSRTSCRPRCRRRRMRSTSSLSRGSRPGAGALR